ncbi:S-layer homology domain-containing protein [Candidatus Peregrinibacteria bacterium]|nr:S-layer homology domain-containing protein [Candidatus Peregrinibacteria bacterium]
MSKKFLRSVAVTLMLMAGFSPALANTSAGNGYNAPVIVSSLNFTATVMPNGEVMTSWVPYVTEGFNYYKVVRSADNLNPVYPDDGYIFYTDDPEARSYLDKSPLAGKAYYRVCSIASPNRYCSEVVVVENGNAAEAPAEVNPDVVVTPATLKLLGSAEQGYAKLTWGIQGKAPYGFKVCKSSVNKAPTYPIMKGDAYQYLSDPLASEMKDTTVRAGQTYYYRVCQYDGKGACVSYSNAVAVTMATDGVTATEDKLNSPYAAEEAQGIKVEPVVEKESGLKDIENHSYKEAIGYLLNKKVVQGYADKTFKPDTTVNRAEFVKMILESKYGKDTVGTEKNCFRDVKDAWYSPYVCMAKKDGVLNGYPDGSFKPSREISFAEAAKVLAELYGIQTVKGGNWYEGYVKALQKKKYIPQTVTAPEKKLTRGEVAELLWRVEEQKTDQPSSEMIGGSTTMDSGAYAGWQAFEKNGYSFYYPSNWYRGLKSYGWDMLSEEKDYIDNLNVQNYMAVDTYVATYVASKSATSDSALMTKPWFGHPQVSVKTLTVNGLPALRRSYRAPSGTVVNGRTTGENEIIILYTYRKGSNIIALQYFNAMGDESYGVDQFDKIAMSVR